MRLNKAYRVEQTCVLTNAWYDGAINMNEHSPVFPHDQQRKGTAVMNIAKMLAAWQRAFFIFNSIKAARNQSQSTRPLQSYISGPGFVPERGGLFFFLGLRELYSPPSTSDSSSSVRDASFLFRVSNSAVRAFSSSLVFIVISSIVNVLICVI